VQREGGQHGESQFRGHEVDKFMAAQTWYIVQGVRPIRPLPLTRLLKRVNREPLAANFKYGHAICELPDKDLNRLLLEPESEELDRILATATSRGQGFIADARERRAIERRAMQLAERYYRGRYPSVRNTAQTRPFDFHCVDSDGHETRVEVKGSMGDCSEINLTVGEVESARGSKWRSDLFLVIGIRVVPHADGPRATGGRIRVFPRWVPKADALRPLVYRYAVPEF
jgi:hypothetical protein